MNLIKLNNGIIIKEAITQLRRLFEKAGRKIQFGQIVLSFHQGKCVHIDYQDNTRVSVNNLQLGSS